MKLNDPEVIPLPLCAKAITFSKAQNFIILFLLFTLRSLMKKSESTDHHVYPFQ